MKFRKSVDRVNTIFPRESGAEKWHFTGKRQETDPEPLIIKHSATKWHRVRKRVRKPLELLAPAVFQFIYPGKASRQLFLIKRCPCSTVARSIIANHLLFVQGERRGLKLPVAQFNCERKTPEISFVENLHVLKRIII